MIETLSTSCYLWKVNRNRRCYEVLRKRQRRAFWLAICIFACVVVSVVNWIIFK